MMSSRARNGFLTALATVLLVLPLSAANVRIIQTNSAGDNVHLIDPVTNKVVGVIEGIEVGHGAAATPDGSKIFVSNEADHTLDIVDGKTLKVVKKVKLSGRPNNIGIGKDGKRVYVSIRGGAGAVDVVDTTSGTLAKSIAVKGDVHNTYVTPDGKYVVSGSIAGKVMTVIDAKTEEPVWSHDFDLGVRPMAFSANPDGSTKWAFVQLSELNGFAVIDFATRKEIHRIKLPELAPGQKAVHVGGNVSHGLAVTPDAKTLIVNSRLNSAVYKYSLPDLKLVGQTDINGIDPNWVTLTPDGKMAYVAIAGSNWVAAIDIATMKQAAKIPVGYVPKRNATIMVQ
jgi:YVTN family beta-propeller protein